MNLSLPTKSQSLGARLINVEFTLGVTRRRPARWSSATLGAAVASLVMAASASVAPIYVDWTSIASLSMLFNAAA